MRRFSNDLRSVHSHAKFSLKENYDILYIGSRSNISRIYILSGVVAATLSVYPVIKIRNNVG